MWDIKKQSAVLVWGVKEHRKAVTSFSLFEPGESLLSGSADKTIRVCIMLDFLFVETNFFGSHMLAAEESKPSALKLIFLLQVWQMVQRKLELIEVIATKEPIRKLDTYGKTIFASTQGHRMKVMLRSNDDNTGLVL